MEQAKGWLFVFESREGKRKKKKKNLSVFVVDSSRVGLDCSWIGGVCSNFLLQHRSVCLARHNRSLRQLCDGLCFAGVAGRVDPVGAGQLECRNGQIRGAVCFPVFPPLSP